MNQCVGILMTISILAFVNVHVTDITLLHGSVACMFRIHAAAILHAVTS